MTSAPSTPDLLAHELETTRTRTLALAELDDDELVRQHSVLMSPLVWDLAHIGQQEDLWLLRDGDPRRQGVLSARVEQLYDAFEHPRAERPGLPLLPPHESRTFLSDVRGRVLERLERAHDLFAFAMVLQHEVQHGETMLATHQLRTGPPALGAGTPLPAGRPVPADSVLVPAGRFVLGVDADDEPFSLDNERPAHLVDLPAFRIGRVPVTVGEWQQFAADGGYDEPHWWSARGWQHRTSQRVDAPLHWSLDGSRRRFGHVEALPPSEPAQHVDYFEAEAYAAWAGGRLPTEQEWEKACCWDPVLGRRRRWPWGEQAPTDRHANLGGTALRPAPVGSYPAGASAYGVEQLIGDVWEWTSSPLRPWPGFTPMIYDSYSAPFFGGDYRVLRGGSWATTAGGTRPSFRNWDHPVRRQIFTGVRVAWDA